MESHPIKKNRQHYFIGALFKDQKQIQELVRCKKNIKNKVKAKYTTNQHGYHSNYQLSTNLIYLGYLEQEIAEEYMNNTFSKLLIALTKNIGPLLCEYTDYSVSEDQTYYKISLDYKDIDNKLNNIILPYLYENGIKPIYHQKNIPKSKIDLLYVNKKEINYFEKRDFFMKPPNTYFTLDYLTLIKGVPVVSRSGTPSVHDQMNLEEIEKYKYFFSKSVITNSILENNSPRNQVATNNNSPRNQEEANNSSSRNKEEANNSNSSSRNQEETSNSSFRNQEANNNSSSRNKEANNNTSRNLRLNNNSNQSNANKSQNNSKYFL